VPGTAERTLIRRLAAAYPRPSSALLPALHLIRTSSSGAVPRDRVKDAAEILGLSAAHAWGAATFYSMFLPQAPGKFHLQVDTNIPALLAGSDTVLVAFEEILGIRAGESTTDGLFTLSEVEDVGAGGVAPAVMVNDTLFGGMTPSAAEDLVSSLRKGRPPPPVKKVRSVTACSMLLRDTAGPTSATASPGVYEGFETARRMEPGEIIAWVEQANLRGRGGAGYPTGQKWRAAAAAGRPVTLVCNADEGEPGTFKDRYLLENDPHLLLEGIAIAARALDAHVVYVYVRGEYRAPGQTLEQAAAEARNAGLLEGLDLVVHYGAGSYLCGEETALIASLQGGRGEPSPKPPYPTEEGLYGSPTVVNNVETLAALPAIFAGGPRRFREVSPILFSVCGHVELPGVYEYPAGTSLRTLLDAAGGVSGNLKGVFVGGLSSRVLRAKEPQRIVIDYNSSGDAVTSPGSGAVIVMNDTVSLPRIAARAALFFARESCGLCAPCREGMFVLSSILAGIRDGTGLRGDRERALELCRRTGPASLCPGGKSFASSLAEMLTQFAGEFM
jgi:NADH:ubiquinone oxidoreductase subunit F (NADH-binding)/NADH:ubiquinone oxidoreductase subunit E